MKVSAAVVLAVLLAALAFSIRLIGDASFTEPVPVSIPPVGTPAEPQRQAQPVTMTSRPDRVDSPGRAPAEGAVATARHDGKRGVEATRTRGQHKHTSAPAYRRVGTVEDAAPAVRDSHRSTVAPQSTPASRPRPADTATDRGNSGPGNAGAPSGPSGSGGSGSGGSGTSGSGSGTSGSGTSGSGTSGSGTSGSGTSGSGTSGSGTSGSGTSGSGDDDHEEDGY